MQTICNPKEPRKLAEMQHFTFRLFILGFGFVVIISMITANPTNILNDKIQYKVKNIMFLIFNVSLIFCKIKSTQSN